jgi:hypothetical protein
MARSEVSALPHKLDSRSLVRGGGGGGNPPLSPPPPPQTPPFTLSPERSLILLSNCRILLESQFLEAEDRFQTDNELPNLA